MADSGHSRGAVRRAWGPVALAAPALAFPLTVPWFSVVCLAAASLWLILNAIRDRRAVAPDPWSPLTIPVIGVGVLAFVAAWTPLHLDRTLPKLGGVALGLLTYRTILLTATDRVTVWRLGLGYLALGCVVVVIALLSGPVWKWDFPELYSSIPRLFRLPSAERGVNANALGGLTLFFLPLSLVLAWRWPDSTQHARQGVSLSRRVARDVRARAPYVALALFLGAVLALSQSRTAWVSAALTLPLVLSIRSRAVVIVGTALVAAGVSYVWWYGPALWWHGTILRYPNVLGSIGNDDRTLIWRYAVRTIELHPWTGVGLGVFRDVIQATPIDGVYYPEPIPHAHNIFMQVALDVGLPGLAAYLCVLAVVTFMTWRVIRTETDSRIRSLCLGLWGGLVAIHLFGLADAIALGAKVGLFFWCAIALIAASYGGMVRRAHLDTGTAKG